MQVTEENKLYHGDTEDTEFHGEKREINLTARIAILTTHYSIRSVPSAPCSPPFSSILP
jgi:hypothetical protein